MLHIVGFLDWICWIQYHIFLPSERTIPVVLKIQIFFEQIFSKILEECMKFKLVDTEQIFVDSTHVKACANSKKDEKTGGTRAGIMVRTGIKRGNSERSRSTWKKDL